MKSKKKKNKNYINHPWRNNKYRQPFIYDFIKFRNIQQYD